MSDAVLRERQGRKLIITINRPEARNAVNLAVSRGLADAIDELDSDPDLAGAIGLAGKISANGPLALAATKDVLLQSADCSRAEMWKKQMELIIPVFTSNDAREGAVAFAEKCAPNWTGT